MGRLNRCTFHPKKDYEYGQISGNYNPNDTNPKLIRRQSDAFDLENQIYGLYTSKDTYPFNPNPTQYAIDFYSIYNGMNKPSIAGLTEPIEGYGMGSFINSPYKSNKNKNVKWKIEEGIIYVKAYKFISYNTELLMPYGIGYPYHRMH
jgi:hypothetical protein